MNTNTNQTSTPTTRQEMADQMIDSLNRAMRNIQNLDLRPTENNCTLIVDALNAIKEAAKIYTEIVNDYSVQIANMQKTEEAAEPAEDCKEGQPEQDGLPAVTEDEI